MSWKNDLGVEGDLSFDRYQELAQRTSATVDRVDKIENGVMGLGGEAGECIDLYKKHRFQGHELDFDKLKDELSDVLWYIAETAAGAGFTIQEIAEHNIEKLCKRFPDGFSVDRSVNRDEEEEIPFVAFGNDEIQNSRDIEEYEQCPNCKAKHKTEYGESVGPDGIRKENRTLAFVHCPKNGKSYMVGLKGKRV